jgi:hypothetical protein
MIVAETASAGPQTNVREEYVAELEKILLTFLADCEIGVMFILGGCARDRTFRSPSPLVDETPGREATDIQMLL